MWPTPRPVKRDLGPAPEGPPHLRSQAAARLPRVRRIHEIRVHPFICVAQVHAPWGAARSHAESGRRAHAPVPIPAGKVIPIGEPIAPARAGEEGVVATIFSAR